MGRVRKFTRFRVAAEAKADNLKQRFKTVSVQLDRALWVRRLRAKIGRWAMCLLFPVVIVSAACLAIATTSPWPVSMTIRHLLAAPNCDAARAVNLAPASRGNPGYYSRFDADNDGIACEPWR